jgi:GT2 family glycosyltransferase
MLHKVNGDGSEYGGFASIERNFSAVTAAAIAFRREVFDEAGGFDEFFRVDYNDVDFCLRLGDLGYRVVLTPAATLYHFHNSSFQRDHDNGQEKEEFVRRWVKKIDRDPFFSKNFQKKHHDLPLVHSDIGTRT